MKAKVKATTTCLAVLLVGGAVAFRSYPRSPVSARRSSVAKTARHVDQPAVGAAGAVSAMQAMPLGDIGLVQDARQLGAQQIESSVVASKRSGPMETRPSSIISSPLAGILLAEEAETIDGESSVVGALLDKLADVKERAEEKKLEEAEMKKKINDIKEKAWEEARQIEQQYQERTEAKKVDEAQMEKARDTIEEVGERAKKEVERVQGQDGNDRAGAKDESAAQRKEDEEKARVLAEEKAKAEADAKLKEQQERERLAAEQKQKEEAALKEKQEKERLAAEQRSKEEAQERERVAADERAKEEAALKEKQEKDRNAAEQKAMEAQERERLATERREKEVAELKEIREKERFAAEQKAKEEAQSRERLAAERRAKEMAELKENREKERLAAEARAKEEAQARERLAAENRAKEESALKEKLKEEQVAVEQKSIEEPGEKLKVQQVPEGLAAEQRAIDEAQERERLVVEQKAHEEAALKAAEQARDDAAAKLAAEEKAREILETEVARGRKEQERLESEVRRLTESARTLEKEKSDSEAKARVRIAQIEKQVLDLERQTDVAAIRLQQLKELAQPKVEYTKAVEVTETKKLLDSFDMSVLDDNPEAVAIAAGAVGTVVVAAILGNVFDSTKDDDKNNPTGGLSNNNDRVSQSADSSAPSIQMGSPLNGSAPASPETKRSSGKPSFGGPQQMSPPLKGSSGNTAGPSFGNNSMKGGFGKSMKGSDNQSSAVAGTAAAPKSFGKAGFSSSANGMTGGAGLSSAASEANPTSFASSLKGGSPSSPETAVGSAFNKGPPSAAKSAFGAPKASPGGNGEGLGLGGMPPQNTLKGSTSMGAGSGFTLGTPPPSPSGLKDGSPAVPKSFSKGSFKRKTSGGGGSGFVKE